MQMFEIQAQHAVRRVARDLDAAADIGATGDEIPAFLLTRTMDAHVLELAPEHAQLADFYIEGQWQRVEIIRGAAIRRPLQERCPLGQRQQRNVAAQTQARRALELRIETAEHEFRAGQPRTAFGVACGVEFDTHRVAEIDPRMHRHVIAYRGFDVQGAAIRRPACPAATAADGQPSSVESMVRRCGRPAARPAALGTFMAACHGTAPVRRHRASDGAPTSRAPAACIFRDRPPDRWRATRRPCGIHCRTRDRSTRR